MNETEAALVRSIFEGFVRIGSSMPLGWPGGQFIGGHRGPRRVAPGRIPQVDGEYVTRMEDVLDLYAEAPESEWRQTGRIANGVKR